MLDSKIYSEELRFDRLLPTEGITSHVNSNHYHC